MISTMSNESKNRNQPPPWNHSTQFTLTLPASLHQDHQATHHIPNMIHGSTLSTKSNCVKHPKTEITPMQSLHLGIPQPPKQINSTTSGLVARPTHIPTTNHYT
jgi:hypothetical protein